MVTPNTMDLLKKHLEISGGQVQTLYELRQLLEKKHANLKVITHFDFFLPPIFF